jgi:NAD(P)H-hydrate epimerase
VIVTTAAEMRRMDALTIERFGVPGAVLMERAGTGAAAILLERFPHVRKHGVVVLAGKGNNGGDGFVVARALKKKRVRVDVVVAVAPSEIRGDALVKLKAWQRAGGKVQQVTAEKLEPLARALGRAGCIVDALFGTGLTGEVRGLPAELIAMVNAAGLPTVALDIPSGLDADRGVPLGTAMVPLGTAMEPLGTAIEAELTIAFAAPKIGTVIYPGARYAGEVAVVDIGIPDEALREVGPQTEAVAAADAARMLRPRDPEAHKGSHGHLAIIAGGLGKTGAAVLAARAATRAGAGLVTVGCPAVVLPTVANGILEAMTSPLPDDGAGGLAYDAPHAYDALLDGKRAAVVGPGIGTSTAREALVRALVTTRSLPLVIDADGLNCLAAIGPRHDRPRKGAPMILTPHPGEMARLTGQTTEEIQQDRLAAARNAAASYDAVVVLKGARTITAAPDGRAWINLSGNPGLAAGGTGDVLAGMIGALLAQGYAPEEAASLGVFLHGHAADRIAARRGMIGLIASDLIEDLPPTMLEILQLAGA